MNASNAGIKVAEQAITLRSYKCGHDGPSWYSINMFGEITKHLETRDECPVCLIDKLNRVSIRCASCGGIIFPGGGVALYDAELNQLAHKEVGTFIDERTALGCMRMNCCPSGGFFGGNWSEEGFVPKFAHGTALHEALATGDPIIFSVKA